MNENTSKRKEWVKNGAIIFLSIMLVLTFFSNTIMNYSLPEVATKYVERNTITAKIRGTGNVEATDPYTLKPAESRVITSVAVKQGDEVEKDDILYYLEDTESVELKEAEKALDEMVLAYMLQLFDGTTSAEVINKVESGRTDSVQTYKTKIANIQSSKKTAESKIAELQLLSDNLQLQLDLLSNKNTDNTINEEKAVNEAQSNVDKAQTSQKNASDEAAAISSKITELQAKLNESAKYVGDIDENGNLTGGVNDLTKKRDETSGTLHGAGVALKDGVNQKLSDVGSADSVGSIDAAVSEAESKNILNNYSGHPNYGGAAGEYDRLLSEYKAAKILADTAAAELETGYRELGNYERYKRELEQAERDLANAKGVVNDRNQNVSNASNALTNANQILKDKQLDNTNAGTKESVTAQKYEVDNALTAAKNQLALIETEEKEILSNISAELDLENKNNTIQKQREEIERLREKSEGTTIKAPVAGKVTSLTYTAGETMKADEAAAVIQVAGKGFTVSFSVTNEQAKKVQPGDIAELQNAWYYDDVKAVLAAIKPDPDNPGQKKQLVFDVTGEDAQAGVSLSLSVGQKSQEYELVVPNSAIREDNNGKFILIVESRNSPLGNRYIATRVDVEVLAEDDTNSAVSGALNGYEYVITTATKPVEAGKQVRLAD